jgi:GT2 family glycosyltransferase
MLYIVIPVFNRIEFTKKCLDSLRKQSFTSFRVIVVDDGSTDGTAEILTGQYPEVIVLDGGGDLYWTAAVNIGIRYALEQHATHIMTLNNDTIAPVEFLQSMVKSAESVPGSILGAVEVNWATKLVHYGGEELKWWRIRPVFYHEMLSDSEKNGLHPVEFYPARGLLIPAGVFAEIGLFDEKYLPHYFADYEFTKRASSRGIPVYANWDARIYTFPEESGDSRNRKRRNLKNYYNHLFNIKGGGNLRDYTVYTVRYTPFWLLPLVLAKGYLQRSLGYWLK